MSTITIQKGIVDYLVPVCTILQVTDTTTGESVVLRRETWFTENDATERARELSATIPRPQRVLVYDGHDRYSGTWQCGERMPLFVIE
jgi:hypothetical protein